ncbi:uncharacterized protein PHACADRAFT_196773 [Phanerochaete carnosa HHB-10118-sp]|uniref:Uncharacterized protein n=1 Tax=Phanerochaete carnosa (strain HHB-10118-sp) TaxID=650164 RepID=K5WVA0_PHACS|nr:uncharacterized protein PHACADRAFT_196773 [Phanerochaete carnosa HHB-10118-sp]EKM54342.1 hypothetical protein PHACADRAFT_196773 [Phanerochaete carnosa HHB-10118-sp]
MLQSLHGGRVLPLFSLLLLVCTATADDCGNNMRRDDGGDDNGDCSSSSHHFSRTATSTSSHAVLTGIPSSDSGVSPSHGGIKGGGIAGIAIGIVLAFLLLVLLIFCLRRSRQRRRVRLEDGLATASQGNRAPSVSHSANFAPAMRTYGDIAPISPELSSSSVIPLIAAAALAGHVTPRAKHSPPANLTRPPSSLPNPHDIHNEPLLARTTHSDRDRDLPPTPVECVNVPEARGLSDSSSSRSSHLPSSFSDPATFLTRGDTNRTRASTASMLHSEMAAYQKRLEAHHEKEMQVRDDAGPSGGLPFEPPPVYQEMLPTGSASDLGEISHEMVMHRE